MKKKVVSFSGGRTSAYLCYLMKENFVDEVDFVFMDTGAEHPKTYDFIRKVNSEFNLNLTCLRIVVDHGGFGRNFGGSYEVINVEDLKTDFYAFTEHMKKYGKSTAQTGWCTRDMKQQTYNKYVKDKYPEGHETWLGIRADEPKRLGSHYGIRYMAEISDFDKEDVLDWWEEQSFDLEISEHLGNCVFCVKKSINKIALAERDEPEIARAWEKALSQASAREDLQEKNPKSIPCHRDGVIYRGNNTFGSIIAKFSDFGRNEIEDTIRSMKRKESGTCTESCEVFVCEANQIDMFS